MFTMFEWFQSIDPQKLERERFGVASTDASRIAYRYAKKYDQPYQHQPEVLFLSKRQKQQLLRDRITSGLNLNLKQKSAVDNWLEGIGL